MANGATYSDIVPGPDDGGVESGSPPPQVLGEAAASSEVVPSPDTQSAPGLDEEETLIRALVRRGSRPRRTITLSREEETFLANRIIRDFDDTSSASASARFRERHERYWRNWRGVLSPKNAPYKGAANVHLPLSSSFKEQMQARLIKGVLGGDRYALFSSLDDRVKPEDLNELNDWFQWELEEVVELPYHMNQIFHEILLDGISLPVAVYAHEERVLYGKRDFTIEESTPLQAQMANAIGQIFENEEPIATTSGQGLFEVEHSMPDGTRSSAKVSFSIESHESDVLVAETERKEVSFDGVRIERISIPDDLVVINTEPEVDKLAWFGSRLQLSVHDFLSGCRGGKFHQASGRAFNKKELEEILSRTTNRTYEQIPQQRRVDSDKLEGTDSSDQTGVDYTRRYMEIYRWEGWYAPGPTEYTLDLGKVVDADEVAVVVWVDSRSRRVIKICRLEEVNKDGLRSPVKFDFIVQPDRFFSVGLMEWLEHIQTELDGIHNQSLDAGMLSNMPWGLYEPTAGNANTIFSLEPGKLYPSKNAQSVNFPRTQFQPLWNIQMEGSLLSYGMKQAGLGEPQTGSFVSKRTSATEFSSTAGAMDMRTEMLLIGIFRSFRRLLYRIFGLYQQYAQDGRVFQVKGMGGERVLRQLKRDRLHGKLMLHLTGSVQRLNAQLERDVAINMMSILIQPLLIQSGISRPDTWYAALEKIVRSTSYTGVPIHKPDMPPMSDPPEVEHKRMMMGETVRPSPGENFQEHLAKHVELASSPNVMAYLPSLEGRQALAQHIQWTQEMMRAVQIMRQASMLDAQAMRGGMNEMGIRPGLAGSETPGEQTGPGSADEGVSGAPGEGQV